MGEIGREAINNIGNILCNPGRPMKERFRALFTLKNIGGRDSIEWIAKCFSDSSALLKHELAYCLGQMKDPVALEYLKKVLEDKSQEAIVRHEAGEALGAIGSKTCLDILQKYSSDPAIVVAETCELSCSRINWLESEECRLSGEELLVRSNPYGSVDPAPASACQSVQALQDTLLDETLPLFERYRAMFTLRNMATKEAVLALTKGFVCKSDLFRHEVAFVLGQLQSEHSVSSLVEVLENLEENEMVRHESAEALGAIASEECIAVLQKYLNDEKRVVRESCEVALDMCEYENCPEFQYANTLLKVS